MYEQITGGFGYVQIVLEEALHGVERIAVKRFKRALLKDLLQKRLTKRGGKLIDQSSDAEIVIINNVLFGIKYLADLKCDARFLVSACEILDRKSVV